MTLNASLQFADADADTKNAFNGVPVKVLLPVRTELYKRTDRPLVSGPRISPWWCFVEDFTLPDGRPVDGLRKSRMYADRLGKSHRDYMRVRAAVSEAFGNSMMHLLIAELTAPVWAFAGVAAGQREFGDEELSHIYLIGGSYQLWIPNLTGEHICEVRTVW